MSNRKVKVMKETARIQIRTSEDMKRRASQLFEDLGLDLGTAINMFLSQSLREGGLPFRSRLSEFDREMEESEASPVTHAGDVENMKDIIHHV